MNLDKSNSDSPEDASAGELPPEESTAAEAAEVPPAGADLYDEELPEEEPLTPELVEEEAIRGDIMLRWAAVLLAVLFGFSKLSDTSVLMHIRSGEHLQSEGVLPDGSDPFSFAGLEGAELTWANLSWGFDHLTAVVWKMGGANGLTIFKAFCAAVFAWLLTRVSVRDLPTWWNSICAVIAIAACSTDFVPTTDMVMIFGTLLVMTSLQKYRQSGWTGLTWAVPIITVVWCNFDNHAWLAPLLILMYALGESAGRRIFRSEELETEAPATRPLWMAGLLSVPALLLNPFPLRSLFSVLTVYSIQYPAMQSQKTLNTSVAEVGYDGRVEFYSAFNVDSLQLLDHAQIFGLVMLAVAWCVLVVCSSRRNLGFVTLLAGVTLLSGLAAHELSAAAIVACLIAGPTAQEWYRSKFSQEYTVDARELMFSRGGRALTVLAFAAFGFCAVTGRLPSRTEFGLGFDDDTSVTIASLEEQLQEVPEDARILHTRVDQGDLLVWAGRRSFIDSRLIPFGRPDDTSGVLFRFNQLRKDLFRPARVTEESKDEEKQAALDAAKRWREEIAAFGITHAMPRLSPPGPPDYSSFDALVVTPEWILDSLGPSAVIAQHVGPTVSREQQEAILPNFVEMAFRETDEPVGVRTGHAQEPDFYQKYIYRHRPGQNKHHRLAAHYHHLVGLFGQRPGAEFQTVCVAVLGMREAARALVEDPDDAACYYFMAQMSEALRNIETQVSSSAAGSPTGNLRYYQSVTALRQYLNLNADDATAWEFLAALYARNNRVDAAATAMGRWRELEDERISAGILLPGDEQRSEMFGALRDQTAQQRTAVESVLKELPPLDDEAQRAARMVGLVGQIAQQGFPVIALETLRAHQDVVRGLPSARLLEAQLMLELGELEEAGIELERIAAAARATPEDFAGLAWQVPTAMALLSYGQYTTAADTLAEQRAMMDAAAESPMVLGTMLATLPLVSEADVMLNSPVPIWPLYHTQNFEGQLKPRAAARADVRLQMALILLEAGDLKTARSLMEEIVTDTGASAYWVLATFYLSLMDEDAQETIEGARLIQTEDWSGLFSDDASSTSGDASQESPADSSAAGEAEADTAPSEPANSSSSSQETTPAAALSTDGDTDAAATEASAAEQTGPENGSANDSTAAGSGTGGDES